MNGCKAVAVIVATGVFLCSGAFAREQVVERRVYQGKDWERVEEPALRPYKAVWRGMKSVVYNSTKSFAQGNEKLPVVGSLEVFRGVRRGTVELVSGTYMGMAGTFPKDYRDLSKPNRRIEDDPLLRNAVDTLPAALITAYPFPIFAVHKGVDRSPVAPEQYKQLIQDRHKTRMERAEQRAHAKQNAINPSAEGRGNLLRLAK